MNVVVKFDIMQLTQAHGNISVSENLQDQTDSIKRMLRKEEYLIESKTF